MADTSEKRELDLVSKVEFRIALAETDAKLEAILRTYLPPLLLKLASESKSVRDKVLSLCQHINSRVKSPSLQLPVHALLKQFKTTHNPLIRHFDVLYVQQGLGRLSTSVSPSSSIYLRVWAYQQIASISAGCLCEKNLDILLKAELPHEPHHKAQRCHEL